MKEPRAEQVAALLASRIPQPQTSSLGRLFDAISSLCGLCQEATFEAKAPLLLEAAAETTDAPYDFSFTNGIIGTSGILQGVAADLDMGVGVGQIAGRFHETVATIVCACARAIRKESGLNTVFLSGGAMMNRILCSRIPFRLQQDGFLVHTHALLPPNDGGVAAGQALVAAARSSGG